LRGYPRPIQIEIGIETDEEQGDFSVIAGSDSDAVISWDKYVGGLVVAVIKTYIKNPVERMNHRGTENTEKKVFFPGDAGKENDPLFFGISRKTEVVFYPLCLE